MPRAAGSAHTSGIRTPLCLPLSAASSSWRSALGPGATRSLVLAREEPSYSWARSCGARGFASRANGDGDDDEGNGSGNDSDVGAKGDGDATASGSTGGGGFFASLRQSWQEAAEELDAEAQGKKPEDGDGGSDIDIESDIDSDIDSDGELERRSTSTPDSVSSDDLASGSEGDADSEADVGGVDNARDREESTGADESDPGADHDAAAAAAAQSIADRAAAAKEAASRLGSRAAAGVSGGFAAATGAFAGARDKAKEKASKLEEESEFVRDSKAKAEDLKGKASAKTTSIAARLGLAGKGAGIANAFRGALGMKAPETVKPTGDAAAKYPWVEVRNPDTDEVTYVNEQTGESQADKPEDFDLMGRAAFVADTTTTAVQAVQVKQGAWERITQSLKASAALKHVLGVAEIVADTSVGKAASAAKVKVKDIQEDLADKWETSQNPWVYNASAAYDSLFSETEMARAIGAIRKVDPAFTMDGFVQEMREELVPEVVTAFLTGDRDYLLRRCSERAMAPLNAALRAREAEGLTVDPTILSVGPVDVRLAQVRDKGPAVIVMQTMVQQINCTRNRKGEIVEGGDDEIRAVYYALAVNRTYNEDTLALEWKIDEMAIVGAVLYL